MKKRLLIDLPFGNLNRNRVLTKTGCSFYIDNGATIYKDGGMSSNARSVFTDKESEILEAIWENEKWFVEATFNHLEIEASIDNIKINFDSLDLEDVQTLARGIKHCLIMHYGQDSESYVWDKFKDFTISIK